MIVTFGAMTKEKHIRINDSLTAVLVKGQQGGYTGCLEL